MDTLDLTDPQPNSARLRERFELLRDFPESARAAWLHTHVDDPHERQLLTRLLVAVSVTGALDVPALERIAQIGDAEFSPEQLLGRQIGGYLLRRLLGRGGMGVVFLCERVEDGQCVALKLLHRGLFNLTEQRWFRRERQLLATLAHPNIAHLIDGGVTDPGIPYLVLEYVDGLPITEYAEVNALDHRARLQLMTVVCEAVAAAHQRLIVHCDLKPGNILVDQRGNPKLLDFGLAKLIEDDAESTRSVLAAMTPEYAAPEQVAGAPVSMATDVYALGVLLHELLLGHRPKQADPAMPSADGTPSQRRFLRGDLDNILRMALSADPDRRYRGAAELGEDLQRHLAALPVRAHPPSTRYRMQKFVQRHRGGIAITAAFAIGLLSALGLALWQAHVASQQSARAQAQSARADSVRQFLEDLFEPVERGLPEARQPTVPALVARGVERLRSEAHLAPAERIDLLMMFARLNDRIGERQIGRALGSEAAQLAEQHLAGDHPTRTDTLALRGAQAARAGDYAAGERDLLTALEQLRRVGDSGEAQIRVLDALAMIQMDRNDHQAALALEQQAIDVRRHTYGDDAAEMAAGYNNLGYGLVGAGQFADAAVAYQKSYEIDARFADPGSYDVLSTLSNWGWALVRAGEVEQARPLLARAEAGLALLGGKPRLMHVLNSQKLCRIEASYWLKDAAQSCPRMLEIARQFSEGRGLFWGYALQLEGVHRLETGELERAFELADAALQQHPDEPEHVRGRGGALQLRAQLWWLTGDAAHTRSDALEALRLFAKVGDADIAIIGLRALLLRSCDAQSSVECPQDLATNLAGDLSRLADSADPRLLGPRLWLAARERNVLASDQAIERATQWPAEHPQRIAARLWRAIAIAKSGDCAAARQAHQAALAGGAEAQIAYPWSKDALEAWQRSDCAR